MVAAARPGPSDARVPCPLCGGLIHPIAGKCKHCKADLGGYHAVRPAAATPLPPLQARGPGGVNGVHFLGPSGMPAAAAMPAVHGPAVAPAKYDPLAAAVQVQAQARRAPVLPPRPTVRGYAAEPRASSWRSWPVVVIALAMVAIVVAVVLMVWPAGHRDGAGKRAVAPPPAPERMQTVPEVTTPPGPRQPASPPPRNPDPMPPSDPGPQAADPNADPADPTADPAHPPARDPARQDLDDLVDPFATPHAQTAPPRGRRRLNLNSNGMMMLTMAEHLCRKFMQCGSYDPNAHQMCSALAGQAPAPPDCPAATRCLEHIDTLSCAMQHGDLSQIGLFLTQFADCGEAARC
jgi:hypothetical protein